MPNENFYINGTLSVKNNVIVHEDDVAYTLKDYILNYSASRFEVKHITGDMTQEQLIAELSVHLGDPSTPEIERRTIYFIQKSKSEDNDDFYDEYAWSYSDGSLERIGSTQIDFDNIDKDVTFNGNATFNGDVIVIKDGVEHNVLLDYDIEQVTSAINTVQENVDAHKNNTNVHITDAERYAISLLGKVSHTDISSTGDPNGGAYYKHFVLSSMYAIEGKLTSIHIAGRGGADQGVAGLLVYQMTNTNVDTVNSSGGRIPESWILIGKSKERTIQVTGSQGGTWTFDNLVVNPSRRLAFVAVSDSQYDNPSSWQIGSTETPSIGTGWSNRGQGDTTSYAVGSTVFEGSPTFELVYEVSSISSHISNNNIHTTSEEKTILRNLSRGTYTIDDSGMFSLATGGQAGLVAGNYTSTVVVNNNGVSLNAIGNNKTITINGVTTTNSPITSTNVITAAGINDTGNAIISGQMLVGGESVFSAGVTFNDFVDCMGVTSFYNNTFTFEKMKHVILDSSNTEGYRLVDYITTDDVSSIFNEGEIGAMVEEAVNKVVVDQTSNFVKSVTQSNADGSKIQIKCNETEAEDGSRNVTVSASYTVPVIGFDENNGATVTTDGLVSASEVVQLFTKYTPIVANIASGSLLGTIQPLEERIESVENTVETLENTVETLESGIEAVQGAVEAIDLTDYAKTADIESTYATKTSIEGLASSSDLDSLSERVDNIKGLNFSAVDELPEMGESGIIYLVPTTTASDENAKDEYIWTQLESGDGSWELIGSTTVDLSGYLTTETAGNTYATKQEISSLAEKSEVEAIDSKVDEAAGKITTIEGQISDIGGQITDIEGQITDIENQLDDIDLSQYITSDDASITYATKDELTDLAQAQDLEDHVSDNTIHVTAEEKDIINNLEDIVDAKYDKSGGEIEGDVTIGNIVEGDTYATAVFQLDELKYYTKWAVIENKYVASWEYTYPKFKPLTNADVSSYGAFCSAISNEYFTATYDGENVILTSNVIGEDGNFFGLALSVDDSDTRHKLLNCRYITLDGGHCQARPSKGVIRFEATDSLITRITYNLSNGVNGDITVENPSQYASLSELVEAYPELMLKFDRVMTRTGAVGSDDVMFMSSRNSEEDNGNTYQFYNSRGYPSELVMGTYDDPTQFQQQGAAGDESVIHSITLNGVNVGDTIKRTNAVSSAVSNSSKCESVCKISESGEVDGDLYVGRAIDDLSDIQYPSFLVVTGFVDQVINGANIQNYRVNGNGKQLENCKDFSDPEELCRCLNETGLGIFELRGNDLIVGFDTYLQTASFLLPTYYATSQLDYLTFNEVHHGKTNKSKASLIMPRDNEPTKVRDDNYYFINAVIVDKGNGETVRVTNYKGDPEYARLLSVINENSETLGCACQLTSDDQYLIQANDYGWDQNNWKLVVIRQKRYGVDIAQLKTEVYQFGSHVRGTGESSETRGDIILNGKSLASFIENKDIHVSTIDRENWNSKVDAEQLDNKFDKIGGLISGNIEIGHGTSEASAAQCKLMGIYPWYDGTLTVGDKTLTVPYNFFVRATGYIELPSETVNPFTLLIDDSIVPTDWTINGIASAIAGFSGGEFFETSIEGLRINIRNKTSISSSKRHKITIKANNLPEGATIVFPEREIVENPRRINQLCDLINQSDLGVTATYENFGVNYNIILTSNEAGSSLNDTSVVGTGTFGKNRSYIDTFGEYQASKDFAYPIAETVDNVTTLGSLVAGTDGDATEYSLKLNGEELVTRGDFDKHVTVHDSLSEDFSEHINDGSIHLNVVQKDYWNSKLNSYDLPVIESDLVIGSDGDETVYPEAIIELPTDWTNRIIRVAIGHVQTARFINVDQDLSSTKYKSINELVTIVNDNIERDKAIDSLLKYNNPKAYVVNDRTFKVVGGVADKFSEAVKIIAYELIYNTSQTSDDTSIYTYNISSLVDTSLGIDGNYNGVRVSPKFVINSSTMSEYIQSTICESIEYVHDNQSKIIPVNKPLNRKYDILKEYFDILGLSEVYKDSPKRIIGIPGFKPLGGTIHYICSKNLSSQQNGDKIILHYTYYINGVKEVGSYEYDISSYELGKDGNERTKYQLSVNGNDVFTTAGGNISGDVNIGQPYRMVIDGDFFGFGDPSITFVGGGNVGSLALVADSSIIQQINNTLLTPSVIPYPTGYTPEMAIRVIVRDIKSKWSILFDEISQEDDSRHVRLVLKPQYNGLVHGIVWVNRVGYNYLDHSITSLFNEKYVFWNVEHAYQPFYKEFASNLTLNVNGDTVITDNDLDRKLTNVVGINGGCVNGRYDIGKNSKTKFYGCFYELTPFSNNYVQSPFPVNGLYFTVTINDEVKLNRELVCDTTIDTSTPLSSKYLNSTSCPLSQYFENLVCEWADKTITGEYKGNISDKVEIKIHGEMLGPSSVESVRCVISNAEPLNGELYVMDAKVHTDDDFDHLLVDEKDNVKGDYIYFTEHTVPISTGGQPVEYCDFQDYVDAGFLGIYEVCDKNGNLYESISQIKSILDGVTNWNSLSKSSFDTLETVKSVGQLRNGTMERHVYRFIAKRRSTLSNVTDTVNDVHDKVNAISEGYVINEVTDTFEMKHDSAFSSTAAQVSITPACWTNRVVKSTLLWTPDGDTVNTNNLTGLHTLVIYGIDTPKAGDTLMVELTQIAEDKIVGVMVIVAS